MERRALIAVVLSFAVLYAYQAFFMPQTPPKPSAATAAASGQAPATGAAAGPQTGSPAEAGKETPAAAAPAAPAPVEPAAAMVTGETGEREIVLETKKVRAVLTNRGGRLKHWFVKGYRDTAGRDVDLVPQDLPAGEPLPFSLRVDEGGLTPRLNGALYRATQADGSVGAGPSAVFEFQDAAGLSVRKEFRLDPARYLVFFTASVQQGDQAFNPFVQFGPGLGDLGATAARRSFLSTRSAIPPPEGIYHNGKSVERVALTKVPEKPLQDAAFKFAGADDHYFLAAAVNPGQGRVEYRPLTLPVAGTEDHRQFLAHTLRLAQAPKDLQYYIGPKSFDEMKAVDGELVRAINFGIFAWLAVPFLSALKWLYGYVGNYGWSIIILTVLMNIVMAPLRHRSVMSMRKMQELQPQLKSIQDRYADMKVTDPARQKMNTEVMNLYREKGVNPASGCIPMLLQFPFLFAFYSLLSNAIELRGAPFGFWIHDLSLMDPYYVTPLLMGATMFWQQKITPTAADPTQQRMMMIMPVVFVAMFLTFPSGLAIYYFVNNLWAIGQQHFTNWMFGPPPVHVARPAAERRVKSVGAGKTVGAEKRS